MTTATLQARHGALRLPSAQIAGRQWLIRAFDLLLTWPERASQRARLRALSDQGLRDVGLSRADVELEAGKPFWRV